MLNRQIPQILNDVWCTFGNDFELSPTGDLLQATGSDRSEQRVIRRLLTNPIDYCWHPTYGAGLPAYVGQALSTDVYNKIQSTITQNIFQEDSVSQNPQPEILFQTVQNGLAVQINYTVSPTQNPIVVTFSVNDI